MKKYVFLSALALVLAAPIAGADDAVRSAQTTLRQAGYYTGEVTGDLNDDTRAALRRFQIRQQLEPSGNLTPETLDALNREAGASTAQPTAAPVAPAATPLPPPPAPAIAVQPPEPPRVDPRYAALFARTPFESASVEVQSETIRKAQVLLSERRIYLGRVDGRPGRELEESLFRFQKTNGLPVTGRLDIDTLAALRLLPIAKIKRPRVEPAPYVPTVPGAVKGRALD